ncbi:glycosyltransferase family 61 protein [Polynucleobacter paneuropaeus]|nr:glycosyltransferase family 61 protein [Polynucleobacter paneuropaeus]
MPGKQKTNKTLFYLSMIRVVVLDFRFGIIKNFRIFIKYLWRELFKYAKLIIKSLSPLVIIQFIEFDKKRRNLIKSRNVATRMQRSIFLSLLHELKKHPTKTHSYLGIYIYFALQFKLSKFLFSAGHWRIARSSILALVQGYKKCPDYLHGLSLCLLINYYKTSTRWTIEYEPYTISGLFLSPIVLEKKFRFLGDKQHLIQKLQRLIINAHKHKFYSCHQLLLECLDALLLLEDTNSARDIKIFYENKIPRLEMSSETLKSISTTLLKSKQIHDDLEALFNSEVILSRITDTSKYKLAIFQKEGLNRLLIPKTKKCPETRELICQLEFTIHFDVFYRGSITSHVSKLQYQSIHIHRFLDINLSDGGLILSRQNAYTQFVHVGDVYLPLFSINILVNEKNRLIAYMSKQPKIIKDISAYCGYSDNYYHWLVECIPRFILMKNWADLNHKKPIYLLPKKLKKWQTEMLAFINITQDDCLVNKFESGVHCEELFTVDLPSYDMQSHPKTLEILKKSLPVEWFTPPPNNLRPKKLLLMRKRSPLQRLGNAGQVAAILKRFGYENVFPESLTFKEQIELFSSATHVVAVGGAAITNCMFMPINSRALVLGPVDQIQPGTFSPLLEAAGVKVTYLACDSIPTVNRHYIGTVFNYEIDVKDLIDCLNIMES